MSKGRSLKDFMLDKDRKAMGNSPTWHCNCIAKTGVARPGKTARDKSRMEGK